MLVKSLKSNYSVQFIIFILLLVLLWSKAFFTENINQTFEKGSFLYNWLFEWTADYPVWSKILAFVFLLFQGLQINNILRTNSISKNPLFVSIIYVALMSSQSELQNIHPFLITNFLILSGFIYLFKIYDKKEPYAYVFNAAALFSLASLFYFSLVWFFAVLFLVFLIYPINKWREWVIAIFGFIFPYFWMAIIIQFKDPALFSAFYEDLNLLDQNILAYYDQLPKQFFFYLIFISVTAFTGALYLRVNLMNNEIAQRKKITVMLFSLLGIFGLFVLSDFCYTYLALYFAFSSYFIAELISRVNRQWLSEGLFFVFILGTFLVLWL